MRWPPVTFTVGTSYLSATSAMARSSLRRGQPAPHARHDRIGAVLLDVGVHALVDEAATARRPRIRRARRRAGSSSAPGGRRRSRRASSTPGACMTAGIDFSSCVDDRRADDVVAMRGCTCTRASRPAAVWKPSPSESASSFFDQRRCRSRRRPRPWCAARTASSVVSLSSAMAAVIVPLQTPLQPQISALSAMAATAA